MEITVKVIIALCTIVFVTSSHVEAGCGKWKFFSNQLGRCVPCSQCPTNKIVLRKCHDDQDTLCGTFKFDFNQSPLRNDATAEATPDAVEEKVSVNGARRQTQPTDESLQDELVHLDDKWFTITMILVGVLVFTCVTGLVLVLYMCVVCRRKHHREIICDSVYTSALLRDDGQTPPKFEPFRIVTET